MVAAKAPLVLCTYPDREHAEQLVALLREHGIPVVAVPSEHHAGEWDVLVPARDSSRAIKMVQGLLALD
jgi:nicotinamidase-related amidase